jgi:Kef-type K+ transport system membrane component KefB
LTTHALETHQNAAEAGIGLSLLRYLDLIVLALALPVFVLAGLPMLGFAVAAAAWLVQRGINALATRRARSSEDPRTVVGLLAGSMIGRGYLVAGSIFAVGLIGARADGLAAAVLCITLFTIYFSANMVVRPFDPPPPGR